MSFEDAVSGQLEGWKREALDSAALDAEWSARRANALRAFATKFSEAVEYLRGKGAPAHRVAHIEKGSFFGQSSVNIRYVLRDEVIAIGGVALHRGEFVFGRVEEAGKSSLLHGIRKHTKVFNLSTYPAYHFSIWDDRPQHHAASPNPDELLLVYTGGERDTYESADEWLVRATASVLHVM